MRTEIILEIPHDDSGDVVHKIQLPSPGEKGFYRIWMSWVGYEQGERKGVTAQERAKGRTDCCWSPTALYHMRGSSEQWEKTVQTHLDRLKSRGETAEPDDDERNLPTVEHACLYDFYAHIGFDRHKRRYVGHAGN